MGRSLPRRLGACRALVILVIACMSARARAQAATETPAEVPQPKEPSAEAPSTEVSPPGAHAELASPQELYDLAFAALAEGDRALATSLLQQLMTEAPDDPHAAKARGVLALLEEHEPTPTVGTLTPEPAQAAPERPEPRAVPESGREHHTSAARAELVFAQTVHGIAFGAEICMIARCEDERGLIGLLMLGGGTGFALSYFGSEQGVTPGFARALTDGALWGAAHGLMFMAATSALDDDANEDQTVGAHLAIGQLLGLGAAVGLHAALEPTPGQVSLTSSGGLWMLLSTAQLLGALDGDFDGSTWGIALLVASDVGLVSGGLLASAQPMSASRVLMIDAMGLVGGLTGLGIGVVAQEDPEPELTFSLGLLGTLTGLGLGYGLTAHWDDDEDGRDDDGRASLQIVPVAGGAMAAAHVTF